MVSTKKIGPSLVEFPQIFLLPFGFRPKNSANYAETEWKNKIDNRKYDIFQRRNFWRGRGTRRAVFSALSRDINRRKGTISSIEAKTFGENI